MSVNQIGSSTGINQWSVQQPVAKPIQVPEVKKTETVEWVEKPQADAFYTQNEKPWLIELTSRNELILERFINEQLFEASVALRKLKL